MDDADGVAELFGFAHHVGGEDDGLAAGAAVADEADDGAGGHDVEADGGLIKNHHRRVVDQRAGDGDFLLHSGRELVAAAVGELADVEQPEELVHAALERPAVQAVQPPEVFDRFPRRQPAVERGGGGEEADAGADFFGLVVDVEAGDPGGAVGGLEDGGEQAQRGGLAGAVRAQEAVDLRGLAAEADVVDGADFPALLVAENLGQVLRFNHGCPGWLYKPAPLFVTGAGREKQARLEGTWGERWDLNPRPSEPQSDALPAELRSPPTGW